MYAHDEDGLFFAKVCAKRPSLVQKMQVQFLLNNA